MSRSEIAVFKSAPLENLHLLVDFAEEVSSESHGVILELIGKHEENDELSLEFLSVLADVGYHGSRQQKLEVMVLLLALLLSQDLTVARNAMNSLAPFADETAAQVAICLVLENPRADEDMRYNALTIAQNNSVLDRFARAIDTIKSEGRLII